MLFWSYSNLHTKWYYIESKKPLCWRVVCVSVVGHVKKNFPVKKKCVQEYSQNMVLSMKAIIMQVYLFFGTKIALKHTKRSKAKTSSTQVFVVTWNAMLSCSQLEGNVRSQCFVHAKWCLERNLMLLIAVVRSVMSMEVWLYQ